MRTPLALTALLALLTAGRATAQYPGWKHSGSVYVLTTPDGADLPAPASVENFPLLVRLHKDSFDFAQARPDGTDLRFSSAGGDPLPYQIEEWDAAEGVASVWVRVPKIRVGTVRSDYCCRNESHYDLMHLVPHAFLPNDSPAGPHEWVEPRTDVAGRVRAAHHVTPLCRRHGP